jgi:hypothetical protein
VGLWSNTPKAPRAPKQPKSGKSDVQKTSAVGQGSRWTGGRALSAKVVGVLLVGGIFCGPAALVFGLSRGLAVTATNDSAKNAGLSAVEQSTGSYALAYVGAWLGASKTNPTELQKYVDASTIQNLTDLAWSYRDAAVVSIAPPAKGNIATVVIAANVKELTSGTTNDGTTETWPRRYFQVAVTVDKSTGDLGVAGLPAPVAAPGKMTRTPELVYIMQLPPDSAAATAVTAFFGAYLAGSGDITRYVSPSTQISAIAPAPYAAVGANDLRVDKVPTGTPADGDRTRVLATVTLTNALEQRLTSTYALTITARADRWEVTSIDPAPQEKTSTGSTTSTPASITPTSPPTGGKTEGK